MYYMIGGDGKEYGPVTGEQLKSWITEGRANRETMVRNDGDPLWRSLGSLEEFYPKTPLISTTPSSSSASTGTPTPHVSPSSGSTSVSCEDEPSVKSGFSVVEVLSEAASLFAKHIPTFVGASLLVWLVECIIAAIPKVGQWLHICLHGVLRGGLFMVYLKALRSDKVGATFAMNGFYQHFRQLVFVGLFTSTLVSLGMLLLIVPGIYLVVAWMLALPMVAERGIDFWKAMEHSRKMVSGRWFKVAFLSAIAFLPVLVAVLSGFSQMMEDVQRVLSRGGGLTNDAMESLVQTAKQRSLVEQRMLLLSMPFGFAVVTIAYKKLANLAR